MDYQPIGGGCVLRLDQVSCRRVLSGGWSRGASFLDDEEQNFVCVAFFFFRNY
jgi:hypothetical protein